MGRAVPLRIYPVTFQCLAAIEQKFSSCPRIPRLAEAPGNVSDRASKCAIVRGVVTESSEGYELSNVVETALAKALLLAAEGERWEIVSRIASELAARRGERFVGQNRARATRNR